MGGRPKRSVGGVLAPDSLGISAMHCPGPQYTPFASISTAILILSLAATTPIGCLGGPEKLPDHRGVRVPASEVPDAVLKEVDRRGYQLRSIERIKGGRFRIETESGSILFFSHTGTSEGMII